MKLFLESAAKRIVKLSLLLFNDFDGPGSLLSLLPGLDSSPAGFNLCGLEELREMDRVFVMFF